MDKPDEFVGDIAIFARQLGWSKVPFFNDLYCSLGACDGFSGRCRGSLIATGIFNQDGPSMGIVWQAEDIGELSSLPCIVRDCIC